jgi:hypothetical protein
MIRSCQRSLLSFPFLSLLALGACSGGGDDGNVRLVLSASDQASLAASLSTSDDDGDHHSGDGFLARLESANITFSSFLARNLDGQLVDLGVDLPFTVDLKALLNGKQVTLPAGSLPAGDYDQFVVVMTELEVKFVDGGGLALTPPGGGWTSIVRVTPFTVVDGTDFTVELKFHLGGAFREMGDGLKFFPEFEGHHR